jgi:hypothetical protein
MLLTSNYVYPAEVTGYVREALADFNINQFTLSRWLPNEFIDDIEYRVAAGGTGLADAATYRAYDAESPIGRSQPLSSLIGELPPISLKKRSGEYDRLRMRKVTDQRIRDALFNDARKLTRDIAARVEVARGQTLVTGTTPIPELGITSAGAGRERTRSPRRRCGRTPRPTSSTTSCRGGTPTWPRTGSTPARLVGSRRIFNLMLRNQAVRNQVFPGANQPSIVTQTASTRCSPPRACPRSPCTSRR